jgi:hypothetical protein
MPRPSRVSEAQDMASEVRVPLKRKPKVVRFYGEKDPRGPDATVTAWLDSEGLLHIHVQYPMACYKFRNKVEYTGGIEIIAE